jgi:pimeloyl-ACP methyl ester carboxylesterase
VYSFVLRIGLMAALMFTAPAPAQEAVHMRTVGTGKNCWVLVHAFGASGDFWQKRAPKLAESHHVRIYYPDLPSHGLSAPTATFNYVLATDALQSALKDLCPKPEVIIGGSSGGIIAMKLGARTHAKHVVGVSVGWAFNDADIKDLVDSGEQPSPGFLIYLQHYAVQGEPQVNLMLKHAKGLAEMGTGPLLTEKEAHALRGRLLVIHGDKDDFFFLPSMEKLVREIPRTQLYLFPGAGHLDPFREPFATTTWTLIDSYVEKGTIGASMPIAATAGAGEPHPAQ